MGTSTFCNIVDGHEGKKALPWEILLSSETGEEIVSRNRTFNFL